MWEFINLACKSIVDFIMALFSTTDCRIRLRSAGLSLFAEVPDLGLVVQWERRGNRVEVRADPRWMGRTRGLCGNMNGQEADDFK